MKKKLEADLMSIAHRILQLKNKDNVRELLLETQKLTEKLSVLLFIEENFDANKPTIGKQEVEEKVALIFDNQKEKEVQAEVEVKTEEEVVPAAVLVTLDTVPNLEIEAEPIVILDTETEAEVIPETIHRKEVVEEIIVEKEIVKIEEEPIYTNSNLKFVDIPKPTEFVFDKINAVNLNDKLKKSIDIGLNDKIAFEKNLFGGSTEDYNRVISQISTFDSLQEAQNFINNLVKPDYNNWENQDEFANRFMEIVENKFS